MSPQNDEVFEKAEEFDWHAGSKKKLKEGRSGCWRRASESARALCVFACVRACARKKKERR
jgi:hypothetical protein